MAGWLFRCVRYSDICNLDPVSRCKKRFLFLFVVMCVCVCVCVCERERERVLSLPSHVKKCFKLKMTVGGYGQI